MQPRRILLVEDNSADVELLIEALQEHEVSCELLVINNGEGAVALIDEIDAGKQPRPDLFIVDLSLPRKPGTAVLERLQSSTCARVPTAVLTSSDSQRDRDVVALFKPTRYLRKPLALQEYLHLGSVFKALLHQSA